MQVKVGGILELFSKRSLELELILDSIKDAVCIVDAQGITKYWNKGAERLFDIDKGDIIGQPIVKFFPNALLQKILKEKRLMKIYIIVQRMIASISQVLLPYI